MNLYEDFICHVNLHTPEFDKKTKVHDWRNYVPDDWVKNWEQFGYREKKIIAIMAEMQADKEEWD